MSFEEQVKIIYNNNSGQNDEKEVRSYSISAQKALQEGNIKEAYSIYDKIQSLSGCGYCNFLLGNLDEAEIQLNLIKGYSSFVNWLISLIGIIKEYEDYEFPTYMQIKCFYEQDLDMLLNCKNNDLAQKIINKNQHLEYFNREIYKYSARVLLNHGDTLTSEQLLYKSLDILYKDPETHYLLGEIYLKRFETEKAKKAFINANKVVGEYLPALKKINDLSD